MLTVGAAAVRVEGPRLVCCVIVGYRQQLRVRGRHAGRALALGWRVLAGCWWSLVTSRASADARPSTTNGTIATSTTTTTTGHGARCTPAATWCNPPFAHPRHAVTGPDMLRCVSRT
ncbi:MAG: hypothetical protein ACRDQ5_19760 [Sciscionella sp.]